MQQRSDKQIDLLYTNIGRGHPFYLDGIQQALTQCGHISLVRSQEDVFTLSTGLSLQAWKTACWLYRAGSSGGIIGKLYHAVRKNGNQEGNGMAERIMARDIRRRFQRSSRLLVAHPVLVSMLSDINDVYYQHGELVTPKVAVVPGAKAVFVPTRDAAEPFLDAGYSRSQVIVSGLCVEPVLARRAEDLYRRRLQRLNGSETLTGAFFSSGAEPKQHVRQLIAAADSVLRSEGRVIIFAKKNGALHEAAKHLEQSGLQIKIIEESDLIPHELPKCMIVLFSNRREEEALTVQLFDRFDYYVGPPHERTNWGIGLGLPMFLTTPTIGPFAPLNLDLLSRAGCGMALSFESAKEFNRTVGELHHSGQLSRMSESVYGTYPIDGFQCIANWLVTQLGQEVSSDDQS